MNSDYFKNYAICRNNFFNNPDAIVELSKKQNYERKFYCPGMRTKNILSSPDRETRDFAEYLADRLWREVFPGIYDFTLDINFHINESCSDSQADIGWIHYDWADLAGMIYLTPTESNFENGTSIFNCKTDVNLPTVDVESRKQFNLTGVVTEEYIKDLKENWNYFSESIKFGNEYNRLVAYDAKMFHRPNNLEINSMKRLALLFFIKDYKVALPKKDKHSKWD